MTLDRVCKQILANTNVQPQVISNSKIILNISAHHVSNYIRLRVYKAACYRVRISEQKAGKPRAA